MEHLLQLARGPLFIAAMVLLVAGLVRIVGLDIAGLLILLRRSRRNHRAVPWGAVVRATLKALRPLPRGEHARGIFSVTSILFHVSIIITPIFLGGHILLWRRGLGVSWPAISNAAADWLSLVAVTSALLLLAMRAGSRAARAISRPQDYLLLIILAAPFLSGLLVSHPHFNPLSHDAAMLVHALSGDLVLMLIPFTKMSHVVRLPVTQLITELGWHLEPGAGERVARALHTEEEPI